MKMIKAGSLLLALGFLYFWTLAYVGLALSALVSSSTIPLSQFVGNTLMTMTFLFLIGHLAYQTRKTYKES